MNIQTRLWGERAVPLFLIALCLLSYARLYMLRDVYADDNCWLFGIYLGYDLPQFLNTGFLEMRREPLGIFLYFFFLPFRFLENPYAVWHGIVIAAQIATTLLFHRLVLRLCADGRIAALAAAAFVVVPLDHALPYLSSFNYRAGLLLALASLYLTDRAAERRMWGLEMWAALLLTGLAAYCMSEATFALEPARLALLWYRLAPGRDPRTAARDAARWLLPFALLFAPLVLYKLVAKPYGMYAGMYETGIANLFDWRALAGTARLFLLGEWWFLRRVVSYAEAASVLAGLAAGLLILAALLRDPRVADATAGNASARRIAVFALIVLVPQLALFLYAGRSPRLGFDSTHAVFAQLGYAALVGLAAHRLLRWATARHCYRAAALALAGVSAAGIFFNNLRLDMFAAASREQDHFWKVFQQRFPELPPRADWLIDARPRPYRRKFDAYFEWEDLHATYDLEFALNRLYAPPHAPPARNHRVYTPEEARHDPAQLSPSRLSSGLRRLSHYGEDRLDSAGMTVVYYRDGRLLVNEEIVKQAPDVPYRHLASKPVPAFARPVARN